jgi:hypothetical protein
MLSQIGLIGLISRTLNFLKPNSSLQPAVLSAQQIAPSMGLFVVPAFKLIDCDICAIWYTRSKSHGNSGNGREGIFVLCHLSWSWMAISQALENSALLCGGRTTKT